MTKDMISNDLDIDKLNWRFTELDKIVNVFNGSTPKRSTNIYWENGKIPWFTIDDIREQGRIIKKTKQFITEIGLNKSSVKLLPKGTVLLCCTASIGEYAITDIALTTNQQFNGLVVKENARTLLLPKYLFYFVSVLKDLLLRLSGNAIFGFISVSQIKKICIPLPPIEEQKRIAEILDKKMELIEKLKQLVNKQLLHVKALRQAYLSQAFKTDPLPPGWNLSILKQCVSDAQTGFACGERDPNGVVQLRMNNVTTNGKFLWDQVLRVPTRTEIDKYYLKSGDVLFNNTNSTELVGKSACFISYKEQIVYSNHFTRIRTNNYLDSRLLTYWFIFLWNNKVFYNLCNVWIGQSAVKNDKLLSLEIPLPPIDEQKRIVEILDKKMELIEKLDNQLLILEKLIEAIPQSYLKLAFSGKLTQDFRENQNNQTQTEPVTHG